MSDLPEFDRKHRAKLKVKSVGSLEPPSELSEQKPVVSGPEMVKLEIRTVYQIRQLLVDALGNAESLLFEHERSLGRTTKKNKATAEMYEAEIANTRSMIALLNQWQ